MPTPDTRASGIELIAAERQRQIEQEGWSASHDDAHRGGDLALAAARYALHDVKGRPEAHRTVNRAWPWASMWWKPNTDPVRNLVKAGALIAAEIDRLQRAKS